MSHIITVKDNNPAEPVVTTARPILPTRFWPVCSCGWVGEYRKISRANPSAAWQLAIDEGINHQRWCA